MINKIKSYFNGIKVKLEVEPANTSIQSLDNLYKLLKSEYTLTTVSEVRQLNPSEIKHYNHVYKDKAFSIYSADSYASRKAIEIVLEEFPESEIVENYKHMNKVSITYNSKLYESRLRELSRCSINKIILPEIAKILNKMEENKSNSFQFLLDKYESTFLLLQSTILEIKEESEIDKESKAKIVEILNTFIDEYSSMEAVFEKRSEAYKEDIKNSINQRLQDELKFVSDRKTSWDIIEIEPKYESGLDLINKL